MEKRGPDLLDGTLLICNQQDFRWLLWVGHFSTVHPFELKSILVDVLYCSPIKVHRFTVDRH
jgi:hypothetical protein